MTQPPCRGAAWATPSWGSVDDLVRDVRLYGVDTVIVALPPAAEHQLVETLNKLNVVPVDVRLCPSEFALRLGAVQASHIGGHTFFNVIDRPLRDWRWIAKSVEDRILGALILAMISPVMLVIALLIRLDSPGPVLFRQKRYGFNNELIEVLKFRTMYQERSDANGDQLTQRNDPRVTRVGAFLRRTARRAAAVPERAARRDVDRRATAACTRRPRPVPFSIRRPSSTTIHATG